MIGVVTPAAYGVAVATAVIGTIALLVAARRHPGRWTITTARVIGVVLAADGVSFVVALVVAGTFSVKSSFPLPLCDVGVLVAAAACWWRLPTLVELTYFWGLAGTVQAVITPDLGAGFPHLVFFQYMVGHLGIVMAALFLVVGMRVTPRPKAVPRVFAITAAYTAFVGVVDALSGANYMFLSSPPSNWTLLRVLGPWPWYVLSACGVALVLLVVLDAPFWPSRARAARARAGARSGDERSVVGPPGRRDAASGGRSARIGRLVGPRTGPRVAR